MFRSILGFAVFAVLAWIGLKIVFGLLGGLLSLLMTVLYLAALGFLFYLARCEPQYGRQGPRHDQGTPRRGRLAVPGQYLARVDVDDLPAVRLLREDERRPSCLGLVGR